MIYINVDSQAGDKVSDTIREMVHLANLMQCQVRSNCNGVHVHVNPRADSYKLYDLYLKELKNGNDVKVARG